MIKFKNVIQEVKEVKSYEEAFQHFKNVHTLLKLAIKDKRDIIDIKDELVEYRGKKIIKTTIILGERTILFT
ncbi:hypothetical protein [Clostridium sardiniense]|uniref:hypothetical protein n=1 Tax=Clostridium sardiniense TaxID=29369 RepID=UPI0019590700|nr:hypothetical protein [Clostridium sardiniense]MBM7835936.1 hypothetical protein [Clostridium sardiniense]